VRILRSDHLFTFERYDCGKKVHGPKGDTPPMDLPTSPSYRPPNDPEGAVETKSISSHSSAFLR
jgi:hypothetical protein